MSTDMELSCDEKVIREMGRESKKAYSALLLSLASGKRIINGSPLAFREGNVRGRIKNVLNYRKPAFWIVIAAAVTAVCVSAGLAANPKVIAEGKTQNSGYKNQKQPVSLTNFVIAENAVTLSNGKVYIFVHGKMSSKESAQVFAEIAASNGYQTISFDLPEHDERMDTGYKCNIINGIADLTQVGDYVFDNWKSMSLFGCSLGAFFSLQAYCNRHFDNCLFQSPIVNMEYLIRQMFLWFHITEEDLMAKDEISTPIDTMSWPYYLYVKEHPVDKWTAPTHILYGAKDNLQSREVINAFVNRFNCHLTVAENSEHPFMGEGDKEIAEAWIKNSLYYKVF